MFKGSLQQHASSSIINATDTKNDTLVTLDSDTAREASDDLSSREIANFTLSPRVNQSFFQSTLTETKAANPLLKAVAQGKPVALSLFIRNDRQALLNYAQKDLVRFLQLVASYSIEVSQFESGKIDLKQLVHSIAIGPDLLFKKGQVEDPAGQTFYDVSPYQLMTFLCDEDMKQRIMQLVTPMTEEMELIRKRQYAQIDCGGADLVKMDRDPLELPFKELTQFIVSNRKYSPLKDVTFPLLENPDGIIYYLDQKGETHLYYANQETQTVEPLEPTPLSQKENDDLDKLLASIAAMEDNSSRRSTNAEHQLIGATMKHTLTRKGIQYDDQHGVRFRDSCAQFNQYFNAYRKCIRLNHVYNLVDGYERNDAWITGVGLAQRSVIWLLQRICEKDRPFYPLLDFKKSPFKREFITCNEIDTDTDSSIYGIRYIYESDEPIVSPSGKMDPRLGSEYAISKNYSSSYRAAWIEKRMPQECDSIRECADLVAICRLVESAKANVVELTEEQELQTQDIVVTPHRSPG